MGPPEAAGLAAVVLSLQVRTAGTDGRSRMPAEVRWDPKGGGGRSVAAARPSSAAARPGC